MQLFGDWPLTLEHLAVVVAALGSAGWVLWLTARSQTQALRLGVGATAVELTDLANERAELLASLARANRALDLERRRLAELERSLVSPPAPPASLSEGSMALDPTLLARFTEAEQRSAELDDRIEEAMARIEALVESERVLEASIEQSRAVLAETEARLAHRRGELIAINLDIELRRAELEVLRRTEVVQRKAVPVVPCADGRGPISVKPQPADVRLPEAVELVAEPEDREEAPDPAHDPVDSASPVDRMIIRQPIETLPPERLISFANIGRGRPSSRPIWPGLLDESSAGHG